ncbi:MAG: toll/interleukin-1 receptor domain-containing protein [Nitrosotalea sp.]
MRVFISYPFADTEIMKQMTLALSVRGIEFYTAEHDVQFGKPLSKKIHDAIKKSDALIAIITKDHPSPSVDQEVGFAINEGIDIIPFVEEGAKVGVMLLHMEQKRFTKGNIRDACDKVANYIVREIEPTEEIQSGKEEELVDERKALDDHMFETYGYNFEEGDLVTGKISSDLPVNIFVLDNRNLGRFEQEDDFNYELESEQVTRYSLKFEVPKTRVWNIVIDNTNSESTNIDVKLSVKKA